MAPLAALLPIIASIAPTIVGKVLGEKNGETASKVLEAAAAVAGMAGNKDAAALAEALSKDNAALAAFRLRLIEIEDAQRERDAEDRINARAREIAFTYSRRGRDWIMVAVGLSTFASTWAITYWLLTYGGALSDAQERIVTMLLGACLPLVGSVVNYYFGSSAGSAAKDEDRSLALRRAKPELENAMVFTPPKKMG